MTNDETQFEYASEVHIKHLDVFDSLELEKDIFDWCNEECGFGNWFSRFYSKGYIHYFFKSVEKKALFDLTWL